MINNKIKNSIFILFILISLSITNFSFAYFVDQVESNVFMKTGGYQIKVVPEINTLSLPDNMKPGDESEFTIQYENTGNLTGSLQIEAKAFTKGENAKEFTDEVLLIHNEEILLNEPNKTFTKIVYEKFEPGEIKPVNLTVKLKDVGNLELKDLQSLEFIINAKIVATNNNWESNETISSISTNYGGFAHDVHFDTQGGSFINSQIVKHNGLVINPGIPTRIGHTFLGWNPTLDTVIKSNIVFTGNWSINKYTIYFDSNGGSDVKDITQNYDTDINKPNDPIKEGYDFIDWDTPIPTKMPAENMTIKAKWLAQKRTVTFDPNGGTVSPSKITEDYESSIDLPIPTRNNYTFLGWYTSPTGGTQVSSINKLTSNQTLYAKWKLNFLTKLFNFSSTNKTQQQTINISNLDEVIGAMVTNHPNGIAQIKNIAGNNILIELSGANSGRTEQTGGSYTPAHSKIENATRTSQGSDTTPSSINYNYGGYLGTLNKTNTTSNKVQTGGSYTPESSIYRTGTRQSYGSDTTPSQIWYNSGGYSGYLTKTGVTKEWVQTGGSYTPPHSKTVYDSRSSDGNDSNPYRLYYNLGEYTGYLYKNGSPSKTVISGSAAHSKSINTSRDTDRVAYATYNGTIWEREGYSHAPGTSDPPSRINYGPDSSGYEGYMTECKTRYVYSDVNYDYPSKPYKGQRVMYRRTKTTWYFCGTAYKPDTRSYRYTQSYSGDVTKPGFDTRTYNWLYTATYSGNPVKPGTDTRTWRTDYTSDYSGTITKPESDTRTYETYYDYDLELKYTTK